MVLVDTNVILDLVTDDPHWANWSQAQLEQAASEGPLLINPVIYAELSVAFQPGCCARNADDREGLCVEGKAREGGIAIAIATPSNAAIGAQTERGPR